MAKKKVSDIELIGILRSRIVDLEMENIHLREKIHQLTMDLGDAYASRQLCPTNSVAASQLKPAKHNDIYG